MNLRLIAAERFSTMRVGEKENKENYHHRRRRASQ